MVSKQPRFNFHQVQIKKDLKKEYCYAKAQILTHKRGCSTCGSVLEYKKKKLTSTLTIISEFLGSDKDFNNKIVLGPRGSVAAVMVRDHETRFICICSLSCCVLIRKRQKTMLISWACTGLALIMRRGVLW